MATESRSNVAGHVGWIRQDITSLKLAMIDIQDDDEIDEAVEKLLDALLATGEKQKAGKNDQQR